ncbi:MAG: hypothetical protein CUN55_16850, partial [Phototrophicales bacterium]
MQYILTQTIPQIREENPDADIAITLEHPPELEQFYDDIAAGLPMHVAVSNFIQQNGYDPAIAVGGDLEEVKNLVLAATTQNVDLVAADVVVDMTSVLTTGNVDMNQRMTDDHKIYDYLQSQGYLDAGDITIVVQGAAHLLTTDTTGFDDTAIAAGHDVVTMVILDSNATSPFVDNSELMDNIIQGIATEAGDLDQVDMYIFNGTLSSTPQEFQNAINDYYGINSSTSENGAV